MTAPFAVVVNDDPTQLEVLSALLRKAGLEPRAFTGAEATLADMSARAAAADGDSDALPALVVTDLYMPGIDGWRFCRLLRSPDYAAFNQVPILLVSATYAGEEVDRIAADLGAEAFLHSPVDGKRFVEQVRAILKGRQVHKPLRALIVEDDKSLAGILKKALAANGYQADTALTARAADDAFEQAAYDVAVLDHHLPDGTGDALLDAFRAERPDCVCLMMTTDPGPELALDWMKRGAAAYLRKPFKPDYLIELCERARRERALLRVQDLLEVRTRELRESEEKHRILLEQSSDPIYSFTPEGRYTYVNPAFAEGVGKPVEYIIGKSIWDVFPREEAYQRFASLSQVIRTGEEKVIEVRVPRADGDRYYITTITPIADAAGEVVSAICSSKDITERKRAEDELRYNSAIIAAANDAIIATKNDEGFTISSWNPGAEKVYGWQEKEVLGRSSMFLQNEYPGQDPREVLETILEAGLYEGEVIQSRKDGTRVFVDTKLIARKDNNGATTDWICINRDITERKRAEEALRESEEHYRTLVESVLDGIVIHSGDRVAVANRAAAAMLGFAGPAALVGQPLESFVHPADLASVQDRVRRVLAGEAVAYPVEIRYVKRDGTELPVENTGALVTYNGKPAILAVVRDITARKRAEAEKAALEAQLHQAQKLESVGRLAGGVAHDFNNMLGVILGHAEVALGDVDPAQPLHAHLEEIHKAAQRSANLTRQLLAFARKQTIAPKVLDLNETIEGILKMLRRLIGEDIDLNWRPEAGLWPVRVDPSQIDQVLANLCLNARDAIADVGKLTIETANSVFDADYCALHAGLVPGEYVRLAVSDDGCGMDQETLAHVFEPFFTTKGVGMGTGLGLATVYGIVKQNDGFINAYSEPGQGTTFSIYLPRHAGKAEQASTEDAAEPLVRGHETILLVEDEPAILEMTTEMLQLHGYVVLAAGTPGAAIRMAREHVGEIHLLMTDVVMPEMNGRDLARNLLSIYPHLKRLFTSGYSANVIAHRGVLDDGVHFLEKPFSMKGLAAKVRQALESD